MHTRSYPIQSSTLRNIQSPTSTTTHLHSYQTPYQTHHNRQIHCLIKNRPTRYFTNLSLLTPTLYPPPPLTLHLTPPIRSYNVILLACQIITSLCNQHHLIYHSTIQSLTWLDIILINTSLTIKTIFILNTQHSQSTLATNILNNLTNTHQIT